jgi:NAD+ diphosphatase
VWPTPEPDPFDRDETLRTDEACERLWADPARRVIAVHSGRVEVDPAGVEGSDRILLGAANGAPWFAVRTATPYAFDLRTGADRLSPVERSAALTAVALDNWHTTHPRCARCGETTAVRRAGWVRRCPHDGSEHFPRTDPAVITLVVDSDQRALLGRRAVWPAGWFSTLAGFVEPGETFEQAVVREVAEESGVVVEADRVEYRASQPWPFPASIMVAFTARTHRQPTVPDGEEIAETAWFSREEFRAAAEAGSLRVPPKVSVAHRLIEDWYGGPVPYTWTR